MKYKHFEIRKYNDCDYKYEVLDTDRKIVIAFLDYDNKKPGFNMRSVGLRYVRYAEPGLNEFIIRWCYLEELIIGEEYE